MHEYSAQSAPDRLWSIFSTGAVFGKTSFSQNKYSKWLQHCLLEWIYQCTIMASVTAFLLSVISFYPDLLCKSMCEGTESGTENCVLFFFFFLDMRIHRDAFRLQLVFILFWMDLICILNNKPKKQMLICWWLDGVKLQTRTKMHHKCIYFVSFFEHGNVNQCRNGNVNSSYAKQKLSQSV